MPKITIVVYVEDVDPTLVDPQDIAADLIASYDIDRSHGYEAPAIELRSAEWATESNEAAFTGRRLMTTPTGDTT